MGIPVLMSHPGLSVRGMELEDMAHALSVGIEARVPPAGRWGDYCNRTRTIRLHPELGPLQRDYTLAHEIGHAYHEHTGCQPRTEWEADVWAAITLIRRSEWRKATQIHPTVEAVATELGVLPKVVRIYYAHLLRLEGRRAAA